MSNTATIRTPGRPVGSTEGDARELLLNTATELFAVQGVAATTFAMIGKQAALTPAMLHYYFKDRDQLLDAVVEEKLAPLMSRVWAPVQAGAEAAETIRGVVERLLDGIETMPWVPSLWIREVLNADGLLRERMLRRLPFDKVRSLGEAIARGQANGALNTDLDPLLAVFSALGMVMLHMATIKFWSKTFHRSALDVRTVRRHLTGLLLHGLCHEGEEKVKQISTKKKS